MNNSNAVNNMHYLVSHFKTLLPQRRGKRRRDDDNNTRANATKPRIQGGVDIASDGCHADETTQKPSPNQTT
tara:strand:+ start:161 stop:376 length:216 start_codon:yes stop_codon:yes gene_type:complete